MSHSRKYQPVTEYMRRQVAALNAQQLIEFIDKTPFTPEQRKIMLKRLGEIESDPPKKPEGQSSGGEITQKTDSVVDPAPIQGQGPDPVKPPEKKPAPAVPQEPSRTKVEKRTFRLVI